MIYPYLAEKLWGPLGRFGNYISVDITFPDYFDFPLQKINDEVKMDL